MSTPAPIEEVIDAGSLAAIDGAEQVEARSPLQLFWRRFRRDRLAMAGLVVVGILVFVAIFAPLITSVLGLPDPNTQNSAALDEFGSPAGPSSAHLLGVDQLGRDVLSRIIYGARVSLEVAFISTAVAVIIGVTIGMVAAFYGGWTDTLLSRFMDIVLAFPVLLMAIGLATACSGQDGCLNGAIQPGITVLVIVIALASWPYIGRIVRGQVLSLREQEFIDASRSLGASNLRIVFREILPNLVAPIIVYATLILPTNVLFEASLSYLGVGVQPPQASWGQMIADAVPIFDSAWWYMLFPGLALVLTVLAFNVVGDGLQDALNPRRGGGRGASK
jgi:peptide/nickel transport system permease protein